MTMSKYSAFSLKLLGLARVIKTNCKISEAISIKELKEGKPHPEAKDFVAVWDTGASASAISPKVVDALKLIPMGKGYSKTAGGTIPVDIYSINILLPTNVGFSSLQVSCANMEPDVLIGMDIISQGDFSITNKDGKTIFSFQTPSSHSVDYSAELEKFEKIHESQSKHGNHLCPCGSGLKWVNCHGK